MMIRALEGESFMMIVIIISTRDVILNYPSFTIRYDKFRQRAHRF